jgi:Fe-S-cluster containining protein
MGLQKACPLLLDEDESGKCSIYKDRPLICRT